MDDASEERDLFARTAADRSVFLTTELGVTVVRIAGDRVGEFGLVHRCRPRDIAAGAGGVAIATTEDVLVDPDGSGTEDALSTMDFGPATAVGIGPDGTVTAVSPAGEVAQSPHPGAAWTTVGQMGDTVNAVDPPFIATNGGVVRIGSDGLQHVGLTDVRDVTAIGTPRAATERGVYHLGNGWMDELSGAFDRVTARDQEGRTVAVAAGEAGLFAAVDRSWEQVSVPVPGRVVDVGVAGGPVAITEGGSLLLTGEAGLRPHELGVPGVQGLAVP